MYEKPPPREIQDIIEFPTSQEYKFNRIRFYNKLAEDQERRKNKYQKAIKKIISYEVGEKVLLKQGITQYFGRHYQKVVAAVYRPIPDY